MVVLGRIAPVSLQLESSRRESLTRRKVSLLQQSQSHMHRPKCDNFNPGPSRESAAPSAMHFELFLCHLRNSRTLAIRVRAVLTRFLSFPSLQRARLSQFESSESTLLGFAPDWSTVWAPFRKSPANTSSRHFIHIGISGSYVLNFASICLATLMPCRITMRLRSNLQESSERSLQARPY